MRARAPDTTAFVERDGTKIHYEVMGDGPITVLLLPSWSIGHARIWRHTAPYLSRFYRVVTFDGRGNGRSDRPQNAASYAEAEFAADALAVLDAVGVAKALVVSFSGGARWNLILSAEHPERVLGSAFFSASLPLAPELAARNQYPFDAVLDTTEGWAKFNKHYWESSRENFEDFAEWFASLANTDPHSTLGVDLTVDWALDTDATTLAYTVQGWKMTRERAFELCAKIKTPVFVAHGTADTVRSVEQGTALAAATNAELVLAEGCGHAFPMRYPVRTNLALRDFIEKCTASLAIRPKSVWRPSMARGPKRILFISSPIGLGHARRDVAVANELRKLHPGIKIEWLTKSPVDRILEPLGEFIHPASRLLASEVDHFQEGSHEHCQPAFPIIRNMDEIMTYNFHIFHELMEREAYDLVVSDEGWDVDHFLFEHPELKRAPYVWATDVAGYLPTLESDDQAFDPFRPRKRGFAYENRLVADYNNEMIERIARFPHVRDLAIFVGEAEDVPNLTFGQGTAIRDWMNQNYAYSGYVLGFDPQQFTAREQLREQFGYGPDEKICIVAVGGTGTGAALLERCIAAYPIAQKQVPGLRMIVVAGPRIDPDRLPRADGVEIRGFVKNLHHHMAVCDLGITHGGLTQTMDMAACNVPFIAIPFERQYEQQHWVRTRLERHGAGRYVDYRALAGMEGVEWIGKVIAEEINTSSRKKLKLVDHAPRFAKMVAALL